MPSPSANEPSGSVECPYCGHQVAKNVQYKGQIMHCQKCTSALHAPTYSGDESIGCGCLLMAAVVAVVIAIVMAK